MYQLGTRLLFYEVPVVVPDEPKLMKYAARDGASVAEAECLEAVNQFLVDFFHRNPTCTVKQESIASPRRSLRSIVRWARLLVHARAEVKYKRDITSWDPVAALPPDGAWKVVGYFKLLARGRALIHGRREVDDSDVALVAHVTISSIPGHLRPVVRELRDAGIADSKTSANLCVGTC